MRARKTLKLCNRRGATRLGVLMAMFIAATLVGCEESQNCFPLGSSCTDAEGFSAFFESNVPCCEGVCTDQPPPPNQNNVVVKACQ